MASSSLAHPDRSRSAGTNPDQTSPTPLSQPVTVEAVYDCLRRVIDPELNIDVVSLGLIYEVKVGLKSGPDSTSHQVRIVMTLTTPGCPLAGVFDSLVKDQLQPLAGLDPDRDVTIELTFDPPWVADMISAEARAELGL
ncbi:MAG: hypothetical protein COU69_03840 [Candidatus Pacebacteria bacterium CG10_big_fil_rev_8_21_14_0_10_56_10]|nr:MAG: hypothetical protein COU69_03840 [Candidatus Pacebacteria bacterium CG10_big_fil_rev_8_21_14_0_10_56_10]